MKKSTRKKAATSRARIPAYARKAEQVLQSNNGGEDDPRERSVAVDLAELNVRLGLLREALDDLLASPRSRAGRRPYTRRMIRLAHEITGMNELCRKLRRPFNRLVQAQCRREPEAFTLLALAGSTIKDFAPNR